MSNQINLHNVVEVRVDENSKLSTETYTRDLIIVQRTPIFNSKVNEAGVEYLEQEFVVNCFGDDGNKIKVSV
tara:strand:+ start:1239 stop:1454 length:216 start_codon:yes stop_codon:yes gene_type:complete